MPVVITLSGTLTKGSEVSDVETVLMFIEETGTSEGFASQAVTMDKRMAETTKIKLFFDEIPDTQSQNDEFKAHLNYLQELSLFHNAKIVLKPWVISEIDSHKHPIHQCMDIVLGAMAFHMNKMHLAASDGGSGAPGKKTLAKEELFQHILRLIKEANGDHGFDIYENTQPETGRGRWRVPYRHWKFVPAEFREKKV